MQIEVETLDDGVLAVYQHPQDDDVQSIIIDEKCLAKLLHHMYPVVAEQLGFPGPAEIQERMRNYRGLRLVA